MSKKVFIEGKDKLTQAYFGWQDGDTALFGLKEGYRNGADNLVEIALAEGAKGDIKTLDTYIFPVLYLYRHSIEISLKQIFYRFYGELPKGGHDLIFLWDSVEQKVINVLNKPDFIQEVKQHKRNFTPYTTEGIDFKEIRRLICELQGSDNKADVWRYLMDKGGELYFTESKYVDYINIKDTLGEIYKVLDFIYHIVSEYLSSDPI